MSEQLAGLQAAHSEKLHELAYHTTEWVEQRLSSGAEARVEEAISWQIGRLSVRGLTVSMQQQQRLTLAADGWSLYGFVGSESELRQRLFLAAPSVRGMHSRLELGLAAKLLRDSAVSAGGAKGSEAVASLRAKGSELRAKSTQAVSAVSERVSAAAAAVETRKMELVSGVAELKSSMERKQHAAGEHLKEGVKKFTNKAHYEFGDLTKAALAKLTGAADRHAS